MRDGIASLLVVKRSFQYLEPILAFNFMSVYDRI
jgi:hypothetical protein